MSHTAVSLVLYAVDRGLRGRNILQSLLLILLCTCSRSVRPSVMMTVSIALPCDTVKHPINLVPVCRLWPPCLPLLEPQVHSTGGEYIHRQPVIQQLPSVYHTDEAH